MAERAQLIINSIATQRNSAPDHVAALSAELAVLKEKIKELETNNKEG